MVRYLGQAPPGRGRRPARRHTRDGASRRRCGLRGDWRPRSQTTCRWSCGAGAASPRRWPPTGGSRPRRGLIPSEHETIRFWIEMGIEDGAPYTSSRATTPTRRVPGRGPRGARRATRRRAHRSRPLRRDAPPARVGAVARPNRHRGPDYEHMDRDWDPILGEIDAFLPSRRRPSRCSAAGPARRRPCARSARARRRSSSARGLVGTRDARSSPARGDQRPGRSDRLRRRILRRFLVGLAETGDLRLAMTYGTVAAGFVASDHGAAHALSIDRSLALERLAST